MLTHCSQMLNPDPNYKDVFERNAHIQEVISKSSKHWLSSSNFFKPPSVARKCSFKGKKNGSKEERAHPRRIFSRDSSLLLPMGKLVYFDHPLHPVGLCREKIYFRRHSEPKTFTFMWISKTMASIRLKITEILSVPKIGRLLTRQKQIIDDK